MSNPERETKVSSIHPDLRELDTAPSQSVSANFEEVTEPSDARTDLSSVKNFFSEPEQGTADYLNARDRASELILNSYEVARHRIVLVSFEEVMVLLESSLENGGSELLYNSNFFKERTCTITSVTAKELFSGSWKIRARCKEDDAKLMINVKPDTSEFTFRLNAGTRYYQVSPLQEGYALVTEQLLSAFPQHSD